MKQIRKAFLIIWIPIMIVVCLALIGNIGTSGSYRLSYMRSHTITWTDVLMPILLCIIVSIFLCWAVGLEEKKVKEK